MQHQENEATSSNISLKIHKGGIIARKVHSLYLSTLLKFVYYHNILNLSLKIDHFFFYLYGDLFIKKGL